LSYDFDEALVSCLQDICTSHHAFAPPQATSVADGATQCLVIRQPGMAGGPWDPNETPYMVEPMNMLASRVHEAVAFAGPARTGKTAGMLLGAMAHFVCNDPGDILFIQMTQDKAREFSKTDVRRAVDYSPRLTSMLSSNASDRNTHDIMFKHGMWLRIAWPTVSNVSGSTYRFAFITDIDRIPNAENLDGEGPLFNLALKRTTTFMSRGMALAESSPGIELTDPGWKPATPHEAPPVTGILGIYNRGNRKRWYWRCPHCDDEFEASPGLELFNLPPEEELLELVRTADIADMAKTYGSRIYPPCCGAEIPRTMKPALNRGGRWISEAERLGRPDDGSKIASYWLGGVAAAYQGWESLIQRYLLGLREYALNGSEEVLKATVNTDQGAPYMARHLVESRAKASTPQDRASDIERYIVPDWTRCVVAAVDVQGGTQARFEVQVHAVGPYLEQQLVDRFAIKLSKREGMGQDFAPIDPAAYAEDWDLIRDKVLQSTYRTSEEGREIMVALVVVDTGGENGVTDRAYAFWRRMRDQGLSDRVMLYKGASPIGAPILRKSKVGARNERDKGDVPLYVCNPNLLSDAVSAGLRRAVPGPGFFHFPKAKHPIKNPGGWLPQAFFDELSAEVRSKNGVWSQVRLRNESFDLCRMIRAGLLRLGLDKVKDWGKVVSWLQSLPANSLVIHAEARREMKATAAPEPQNDEMFTPAVRLPVAKKKRRALASPYLG